MVVSYHTKIPQKYKDRKATLTYPRLMFYQIKSLLLDL